MASTDTQSLLVKFDNQVAGHDTLLKMATNDLMVIKPSHTREVQFYEACHSHPTFCGWIPECYGTLRASTASELHLLETSQDSVTPIPSPIQVDTKLPDDHVCLENILRGFVRPCVLDLKIGKILFDHLADEAKVDKMKLNAKNTTIESMAIRISGMKVYDTTECVYRTYKKEFGRSLTQENIINGFLAYFFPTSEYGRMGSHETVKVQEEENASQRLPAKKIRWILESFRDDLLDMREWIAKTPSLELIGSSLLFVYEGDREAVDSVWKRMLKDDEPAEDDEPILCDVRLIDFAHSRWDSQQIEQDPGILQGFDNTILLLNQCLEIQKRENL
ncbi:hypothetical protein CLU79DRAFT_753668 [Phycomyces nitens]|nr:hypothetical protein CLU79DRAFT_753668 [Phycomyces nitens]